MPPTVMAAPASSATVTAMRTIMGVPRPPLSYREALNLPRRTLTSPAHLGPGVAQSHRAVEYQMAGRGVAVAAEVALALELDCLRGVVGGQRRLQLAALQHVERLG